MDNISNCLNQDYRIIQSLVPNKKSLARMFALLLLLFLPMAAMAQPYIITGSGEAFTATRSGTTVGTANQNIYTVIDAIRTNADGADVAIQFGNGTTELNIGTSSILFNGTGKITLSGKISGANADNSIGTISLSGAVSVESSADIKNIAAGIAVSNNGTGTVSISGGTISATTGYAVRNSSTGKITVSGTANITSANATTTQGTIYLAGSGTTTATRLEITGGTITNTATNGRAVYSNSTGAVSISGGTVSATTGLAVCNALTGAVSISGGTISSTTGNAVRNSSTGKITVSGTANITSANATTTSGTIYNYSTGTIEITGGTITNTAAADGNAVYNNYTGVITISGGEISATTGSAVYNYSTGKITVSGTANITSANATTATTSGTINLADSGTDTDTRLEITGGTITNTAADGNAVYNNSTGAVSIGGSPAITGRISVPAGNLNAITEGANAFAPATKEYTLNLTGTPAAGNIALTGGAAFMPNFSLVNANFYLKPNNAGNLILTNSPPPYFTVSVTNGTGNDYYAESETVTITANTAPAGKTFKEWQISPAVTFTDGTSKTSPTAKFAMPAQAVTAEAIYGYVVTATSGTGGGIYTEGEAVELSANPPPAGKRFKEWSITPAVTYLNGTSKTSEEAEFAMPAQAVTATAIYEDLPPTHYAIEITTDGNGIANPSATSAPQGAEITLTVTPNAGYLFKEWQVISGGVTITDNKFTMPNVAVEAKAIFELIPCEGESCGTPIISHIATGSIMAQVTGKSIVLSNLPQNAKVEVFGLNGKRVGVQNFEPVHGALRITVQTKGVYVVKAGGQSLRVVVK